MPLNRPYSARPRCAALATPRMRRFGVAVLAGVSRGPAPARLCIQPHFLAAGTSRVRGVDAAVCPRAASAPHTARAVAALPPQRRGRPGLVTWPGQQGWQAGPRTGERPGGAP